MKLFDWLFGKREDRALTSNSPLGAAMPLVRAGWESGHVLGVPAALCCVKVIGEAFAGLPCEVIETGKDGSKRIVEDHELAFRMNMEANNEVSSFDFKLAMMEHNLLWGNSYSEIVTKRNGEIDHFWLMLPQYTMVMRNADNQLVYQTTIYPEMRQEWLNQEDCLHVKNLSYDGLVGTPPIAQNRIAFELAENQQQFSNSYFKNDGKMGGYYSFPRKLGQTARDNIKKSHKIEFGGARKSNRVAILDEGGTFNPIFIPENDSMWLSAKSWSLADICRIFNLNPALAHSEEFEKADLELINTLFVQQTLLPWVKRYEIELKRKCLGARSNLSVHFNLKALLRGDIKTRFDTYMTALQNGIYSINEVRADEGKQPIGKEGDKHRVQLNMGSGVNGIGQKSNPNPDQIEGEEEIDD